MKYVFFSDLPKGWQDAIILAADKGRGFFKEYYKKCMRVSPRNAAAHLAIITILKLGYEDARDKGII